ncbi:MULTISPECIES: SDR family oxidoreductase [unclassified Actinomadura]|uniref:SDR family NAD(P)-dependent oxidoreductase n=1 Tax=unclassified Actinomadura TaxID=2626254 RepID=UPI0011EE752F|nr:SDR family oxidoreductase [Actinomadura sp. K4S16]
MRVAVVTGAAGAIGTAITLRLQERGFHVIAVDLDAAGLDRLPRPVTRLRLDLTEPGFHQDVVAAVEASGGRCDLLVNNAGIVVTRPFEEVTVEDSRREQLINLQAPMQLSRALYPALRRVPGRIVSVVSLGAMMPLAESAGYCASKAGLRAFMLALAMLERETGVRVGMVHPGAVDTPMLRHEAANGGSALNFLSEPLSPDAVARAVVANLDRPRLETNLPRHDGWLLKTAGLTPGVLPRIRPLLERLAQPGLRKYRRDHGM